MVLAEIAEGVLDGQVGDPDVDLAVDSLVLGEDRQHHLKRHLYAKSRVSWRWPCASRHVTHRESQSLSSYLLEDGEHLRRSVSQVHGHVGDGLAQVREPHEQTLLVRWKKQEKKANVLDETRTPP
jgi:hypothetical protein